MVKYLSSYIGDIAYNRNCVTGDKDYLYHRIKGSIFNAKKIDIIVAFLMESGVRILEEDLKAAAEQGAAIRILCGNYLNITQPQALYLLKDFLGDKVDLRFYNVPNKSFHPKAYMFEYDDGGEIFIGSSNISRSALTDGIEWNYRICSETNPEDYSLFKQTFDNLFLNESIIVDDNELRKYSKNWKRPKLHEELEKIEDGCINAAELNLEYSIDNDKIGTNEVIKYPCPMGAQIEALYELKKSRYEGWEKGLVVAATGVGKTYLAAFDSREYNKILFIAHRDEILSQAERSFKTVRSEASIGYFSGDRKQRNGDVIFATVQTLGRKEYLNENFFLRDEFDYIVIDEFHHAVAENYNNIIEYFRPEFLLGLTATPERLDSQDVFALCDYNLVYEVRLKEAINKGWLVPFRYYGIYDDTDYINIEYRNGKYDGKQLEQVLSINKRADLILQNYLKYSSRRALGFCSSRKHAVFMAKYFVEHGIKACAVISGKFPDNEVTRSDNIRAALYEMNRKEAIKKFKNAEIKVIFSVDIFNEGFDVPEVDMVMFLRPTESPTVFLQQLGRGLRKKGGKKYVNVLDFIGNYKKANLIPFFLTGDIKDFGKRSKIVYTADEEDYPEGCFVNFDFRLIDIFRRMADEQKNIFDKIIEEYFKIKDDNAAKPLRLSMYTYMDENVYAAIRNKKDLNIFRDFLSFLKETGDLSDNEKELIGTKAHDFLKEIENTGMTKMYKMPLLLAFYNNGDMKLSIDDENIYRSFKEFYSHGSNSVDLLKDKNTRNYKKWGKKEYINLARKNPIHFLIKSSPEFFYENAKRFCLSPELEKYLNNPAFIAHFKDIINYKTRKFFKERLERRLLEG